MKKSIYYSLMLALPMLGALTSCDDKDEIVFDSELPQFETRTDAVLLEVIMPTATAADDKIFIAGDFNGGKEQAAANPLWQLEKAADSSCKWGIYLRPETFVEGKTLADGFRFYNAKQGEERTVKNEEVNRTVNPALGSRTNLTVTRWAEYFNKPANPDEVVHDGYAVFVVDNSGYEELSLYAWGDAEAFGAWPGVPPTGTVDKDGVTFKYFDTGEANKGLSLNLIFNNNNAGSQLGDYAVVLDKDYYLELTPDGVVEWDPNSAITHDGFAAFVVNKTGWTDEEIFMYMWGEVNDLNGAWPGMAPTGKQTINGVQYLYFDFGEANTGLAENLIFNNNNGSQAGDFAFTIDRDIYLEVTSAKAVEIDPSTYQPGGDEPAPELPKHKIFVENLTGWSSFAMYCWGAAETFGGWPGAVGDNAESVTIRNRTFLVFEGEETQEAIHLIFNNNNQNVQFDGPEITLNRDYYFSVTDGACVEIPVTDLIVEGSIIVEDKSGWADLYIYAWGDKEYFGGWPGKTPDGQFSLGGKTYKYWNFSGQGEVEHLIFNNNDGAQFDGPEVTLDRDYVFSITDSGFTVGDNAILSIVKSRRR